MLRKPISTRRRPGLEFLEARLCLSTVPVGTSTTVPDVATQAHLSVAYGQLPLSFQINKGQTDPRVNFLAQGAGYTAFLTPTSAVMELQQGSGGNVVAMKIVGTNSGSHAVGLDKQAGVSNDFVGNDSSKWHTNIANYAEVTYNGVYRGINLVYHGDQQQLEYDFVVQPGASPGTIRLAFDGVTGKSLDAQGDLVLHTSGADMVEHAPVAYQVVDGVRHAVPSRFVIGPGGQVGFQVGHYDDTRSLVIDPVLSLSYSTYLGGGNLSTQGTGIAVDSSGDAYVTGWTESVKFPTTSGAFQTSGAFIKADNYSSFVTKFNAAGSALVYSTFLGGGFSSGIAVDSAGNAYVTGSTSATDFPTKHPLQATYAGGTTNGGAYGADAFVTELNGTGSKLVYSTYLGGSGQDYANGIAVDGSGDAYVTGTSSSTNFSTTPGSLQPVLPQGGPQAFVAALNPTGSALIYSTFLGGPAGTFGNGIAVDGSNDAYVTGVSYRNFPTTPGAFLTGSEGGAFVAKLNATGSALVYAAQLSGSGSASPDKGYRIAVDGSGDAYVMGLTSSSNFPTTPGGYQRTFASGSDSAFVTELNTTGTALVYSTFLSGGVDGAAPFGNNPLGGIAVDIHGNVYVTSVTGSTNFPTKNALQPTFGGGYSDAFVAEINPSQVGAASLVYSTYLGGSDYDEGNGVAVDSSGNAYVTGFTYSLNFPTKNAYQPQRTASTGRNEPSDAFVTKIAFN
jgi:Beta-propeller repeat